ncbi:hypothetical protein B9Q13_05860 [Candidatus Marsarchaeota G2 archaeon ECH_B_SAG-G16]|uniref:Uncharacterized protein n=1 Tax=Candidatus Marsarchaeota G2 archaeon ECH_B_SAG-G16 TaxID=1978167 RepID=A0A2R6BZD7_9ARCH|nr:MAG: hypothetical protein B9Q13_05860 [Candidatus Marsarchaeota G2 archaeon ECH_B_SAG-G16]
MLLELLPKALEPVAEGWWAMAIAFGKNILCETILNLNSGDDEPRFTLKLVSKKSRAEPLF